MAGLRPWAVAWEDALYGPHGFYRQNAPARHFRTAAHASASGLLGAAVARLARATECEAVVDVGAGGGELLAAVSAADPGLRCCGVDVASRPERLPRNVAWDAEPAVDRPTLLLGWELLDVVPVPVLGVDDGGTPRVVEVAPDGTERLGGPPSAADLAWCAQWWPLDGAEPGSRAEVGRPRDDAWARLVGLLGVHGGVALAVDYGHDRGDRPRTGTLAGYRGGRLVRPVPDGSCDVTASVALDAVAAACPGAVRLLQREALRDLGLDGARPPVALAGSDPGEYLRRLSAASECAELLDPAGLGGFAWVLHPVGAEATAGLRRLGPRWEPAQTD